MEALGTRKHEEAPGVPFFVFRSQCSLFPVFPLFPVRERIDGGPRAHGGNNAESQVREYAILDEGGSFP